MVERIAELRREAEEAIASAAGASVLEELRVRYLGRRSELTRILHQFQPPLPRNIRRNLRTSRLSKGRDGNQHHDHEQEQLMHRTPLFALIRPPN